MPAAYDAIADWYATWASTEAAPFMARTDEVLRATLGTGTGACWDLACGTGVHAAAISDLGWTTIGSDISTGQLRHASAALSVVAADATALPLADTCLAAVASVLCHTDVPDYAAVCREAARVLVPGGVFAHVGLHPCFVGPHTDRSDPDRWVISAGYPHRAATPTADRTFSGRHVQARVGAFPSTLSHLVTAVLGAGLVIDAVHEAGDGPAPDLLAVRAHKPHPSPQHP